MTKEIEQFAQLGIGESLTARLLEYGIGKPSPIQAEAIPFILEGRDVLAQSQTGTGKTLAYLLPLLQRIDPEKKESQVLVIAPTQELAMQIVREGEKYGADLGIGSIGLIGGASAARQVEKLRQRPHLVVGTPGRLRELLSTRKLKLHEVRSIVLDEADQIFQMGGADDVRSLLKGALRDRQLVFLSATLGPGVRALADREMSDPADVGIEPDRKLAGSTQHLYVVCQQRDRVDTLRRLVRHYDPQRAIVFVNQAETIAEVEAKLNHLGLTARTLYGDADKVTRAAVLSQFRAGKFRLLVATDVAARGLDIPGLELVVHLDPAADSEHYVHRAGRTGRMGRKGLSVSIVTDRQAFIMRKFARELDAPIEERALYEGAVLSPEEAQERRSGASRRTPKGRPAGAAAKRTQSGRGGESSPRSEAAAQGGAASGAESAPRAAAADRANPAKSAGRGPKGGKKQPNKDKGAPKWLKEKRSSQDPS
ncbi:DEAD/DEAH box helicase [Saccharibacillus sp. CPCC 101409]|uniref:DEAD/DEAH box helicase n=1 Tax=Saccharibacillus sp. CPCC 101409 TaxID=3058041 RepID=UPI002671B9BA|nr:DEAD/DEAH box helicase [Saccharibacillus sp. CPCC 101409]MDO3411065.1 DEAD/DEAH box helicase [Saccharibacillus sp. CPCC 101409]